MKLELTLGRWPWDDWLKKDSPQLKRLRAELVSMFAAHHPKRASERPGSMEYLTHRMEVPADDPHVEQLLKALHQKIKNVRPRTYGLVESHPTAEEVKRARFLKLIVYGDNVDEDPDGDEQLNEWPRVLCSSCRFPDITRVPKPFYVNKTVAKKQDVFPASTGMLVVRPRALDLLRNTIGSQIEIGEAVVAGSKKKATGDARLFWVRPKEMLGDEVPKDLSVRCRRCRRPLESRARDFEDILTKRPGLCDQRPTLEHFGSGKADFAVLGGYYGEIIDGQPNWYWPMAMSGALFSYLKSNGVTGIAVAAGSDPPECYWSAKGDPTLESQSRTFGTAAAASASLQRNENQKVQSRKIVASLKHLPWNHSADGYVYFYLTTPELIMLDPMSWEQDSEGPYRVRKFTQPGLYRMKVSTIKSADESKRRVAVDSASLLFVDNAFFAALQDAYDWNQAVASDGRFDRRYHDKIADQIGNRFGVCCPPPKKFKSQFDGDGFYTLDANGIEPA